MKKSVLIIVVLMLSTFGMAYTLKNSGNKKKVEVMTDEQLAMAIDSCIKNDIPVSAEPYIDESKRRAALDKDTRRMIDLVDKQMIMNARRKESAREISKALRAEIDKAWTPLRSLLWLRMMGLDVSEDTIVKNVLADKDVLSGISAYDVLDSSSVIVPMSLYDYVMLSFYTANSEHRYEHRVCRYSEELEKWMKGPSMIGRILSELMYLENHEHSDSLELLSKHISVIDTLATTTECKSVASFAHGIYYVLASNKASEKHDLALSVACADSAVENFSRVNTEYALGKLAQNKIEEIRSGSLSFYVKYRNLPNKNILFAIESRNVDEVDISVYNYAEKLDVNSEKPLKTYRRRIPKSCGPCSKQNTVVSIDPMPVGVYSLVVSSGDMLVRKVLEVSDIAVMRIVTGKEEVHAVLSQTTGLPLTSATVDGKKLDDMGWFFQSSRKQRITVVNGEDKIDFGNSYYWSPDESCADKEVEIVTDRSICRPGQTIHYKLWGYYTNDGKRWLEKMPLELTLFDNNYKQIYKTSVKLNDLGSAWGDLDIPKDVALGMVYIAVSEKSRKNKTLAIYSIEVADYKLRGNKLIIDPIGVPYCIGDTLTIKGRAESADRKGIANAIVTVDDTLSLTTDDDGRFEFACKVSSKYANHHLKLTDMSGETTEEDFVVQASSRPYRQSVVELPSLLAKGDDENLRFVLKSTNANGEMMSSDMTYTIVRQDFKYDYKPACVHYYGMKQVPDTTVGDVADFDLYGHNQIMYDVDTLAKETVRVDSLKEVVMPLSKLKTGHYSIIIESDEESESDNSVDVVDYVNGGYVPCQLLLKTDETFVAGKPIRIHVGSRLNDANITVVVASSGRIISRNIVHCSSEIKNMEVSIPISASAYDQVSVSAYMYKDGEMFIQNSDICQKLSSNDYAIKVEKWRDVALPGQDIELTLSVVDSSSQLSSQPVEIVASMYDSRLDLLADNEWNVPFRTKYGHNPLSVTRELSPLRGGYSKVVGLSTVSAHYNQLTGGFKVRMPVYNGMYQSVRVRGIGSLGKSRPGMRSIRYGFGESVPKMRSIRFFGEDEEDMTHTVECEMSPRSMADEKMEGVDVGMDFGFIRENFRETVFFTPDMRTDTMGRVTCKFKLPDNITRYKMQVLAHDANMCSGYLCKSMIVTTPLTVKSWLPRVVTEGDTISVSMSVSAVLDEVAEDSIVGCCEVNGVRHKIVHASSDKSAFKFPITVPVGVDSLRVLFSASCGNYIDGERHVVPVLPRYRLINESVPFTVMSTNVAKLDNPYVTTSDSVNVTLEYTSNCWTEVLRSLPHLSASRYKNSDTYLGQLESAAIAMMLKKRGDVSEYVNRLDSHTGVVEHEMDDNSRFALFNTFQKRHDAEVVKLLTGNHAASLYGKALKQLAKMQKKDGSFPWFDGMEGNDFITRHVLSTLGLLARYGIVETSGEVSSICNKGKKYLIESIADEVQSWEENKVSKPVSDYVMIHRLYALSCITSNVNVDDKVKKAIAAIPSAVRLSCPSEKIMVATIYQRLGRKEDARLMLESVLQNMVRPDENTSRISRLDYLYREDEIMSHSMLIMAINEICPENDDKWRIVNWLIQEKRTEYWRDTQSTSRAVLAILPLVADNRSVEELVLRQDDATETTVLVEQHLSVKANDIKSVEVKREARHPSWGSWRRSGLMSIDDMSASVSKSMSIERHIEKVSQSADEHAQLKVGDKVKVTIVVEVENDVDFVRITDYRPASFEPVDQLSSYRFYWRSREYSTPHYYSPSDETVDFFVERMRHGRHVFSYECYVTNAGEMNGGYAEVVSMYDDAVKAHTSGIRVEVE